jgi:hypothetical protein
VLSPCLGSRTLRGGACFTFRLPALAMPPANGVARATLPGHGDAMCKGGHCAGTRVADCCRSLGPSGARTGSWRVPPRQLGWRRAESTTVGMAFRRPGGGVAAGLGFCWGSVPACLPSSTPFYLVKCGGAEGI